jgi:aliphatic nitrilase
MKVAAVQAAPIFLDAGATTDKALDLLRKAANEGAGILVESAVSL